MKKTIYYSVFDGYDIIETGKNCTDKEYLRQQILSLIEPEGDEQDNEELWNMTLGQILAVKGWELQTSSTKF